MYRITVIFWWVTIITPFIGNLVMKWLKFSNATYAGRFDNLMGNEVIFILHKPSQYCG